MPGNSFGELFRITTFGESHGPAVGVIIDGVPPGFELDLAAIQAEMDRRRPGQSKVVTQRKEPDKVEMLSGMYEGRTTGTPLMMIVHNSNARSQDYDNIKDLFRPGHADYTYAKKYGIRDYRGGGRASARETAARVAAGAVAKQILAWRGVRIVAYTLRHRRNRLREDRSRRHRKNPMRACDLDAAELMVKRVDEIRSQVDSIGGVVECRIMNVPPGLGEPVFDRLDADLAKAILSIPATKGIEFGAGFAAADMTGSQHNDPITPKGFTSNNAGGVLGGISSGQEIVFRTVIKPASSIAREQQTINTAGEAVAIRTVGRHDPCLCPRAVPVIEAMAALVIEDHFKRQEALRA